MTLRKGRGFLFCILSYPVDVRHYMKEEQRKPSK